MIPLKGLASVFDLAYLMVQYHNGLEGKGSRRRWNREAVRASAADIVR